VDLTDGTNYGWVEIQDHEDRVLPSGPPSLTFQRHGLRRTLLMLAPLCPDPQYTNIYFQLVYTIDWLHGGYLVESNHYIGERIRGYPFHDASIGAPHVYHTFSRYCTNFYPSQGVIIPVNRDWVQTTNDDMVVVCYERGNKLIDASTRLNKTSSIACHINQ